MVLGIIGLTVIVGIVGYGSYKFINNFTLKQTTERYKYVKTKDSDGNEITKIVDLTDEENT